MTKVSILHSYLTDITGLAYYHDAWLVASLPSGQRNTIDGHGEGVSIMVRSEHGARSAVTDFEFVSLRNITSPEDAEAKRKIYSGTAPLTSFLDLSNDENIREYLLDAPGRQRRAKTMVHREMFMTLEDTPETFSIKNGGLVIVARDIEVDEKTRSARLLGASLINGAQTQGVLKDYLATLKAKDEKPFAVNPKFELIVTDDEDLIAEISISRNSQNNVNPLSIAGRKGQLHDLSQAMLRAHPTWKLRTSETDFGDDFIDTERLLQVTTALIPPRLWPVEKDAENPNKVYCYSMRAKCLKEFRQYFLAAHEPVGSDETEANKRHRAKLVELYNFYIEAAPLAWGTYLKWKKHQGFSGSNIRQGIVRDGRKIMDVADGIVFPILAALAAFMEKTSSGWNLVYPPLFDDNNIIDQVRMALNSPIIHGNPWNMGKSRDSYTQVYSVASSTKRMASRYAEHYGAASRA